MSNDDASEPDGSWSDLHNAGLYALECGEFEEAMEHWSDMFECIPSDRIPDVTVGLTAIISDHLRMKVDSAPDCIELDGIDEMAVCMQIADPDTERMIPRIVESLSDKTGAQDNIAHITDTVVLCSELAHKDMSISCDLVSDLRTCRLVERIACSAAGRIATPPGSMMDETYVEACRRTVETVSRLFALVSEAIEAATSGMSDNDLHNLSFDWMDAPEPDYLEPLDRLFSIVPRLCGPCAAPANMDEKRMRSMADEYVGRFVRGPRKKLLKRGMVFRR